MTPCPQSQHRPDEPLRPVGMPALLLTQWSVAVVALALGLFMPYADAASICRWVDDSGRTQMSDVVPDKYRSSATCSDSRQYELSPGQQREAERRAAEQRQMRQRTAELPAPATSSAAGVKAAGPMPGTKRPAEGITDTTDCQTQWRIYDESVACFGPYRTTQGATKPEGFDKCNDIPSPEIKCGSRRN